MTLVPPRSPPRPHRLIGNHLQVWIRCCHNAARQVTTQTRSGHRPLRVPEPAV